MTRFLILIGLIASSPSALAFDLSNAFPGYFVYSVKAEEQSGQNFTELGMFTFGADNTISSNYWRWNLDGTDSGAPAVSNRTIGNVIGAPLGAADANSRITGQSQSLGPSTNLKSRNGSWDLAGRQLDINWSDGSWEKWYVTWEEPNNLYKIEPYAASYLAPGDNFFLTPTLTEQSRDIDAVNGGYAFGGNTPDFTYARPVSEMQKNLIGVTVQHNNLFNPPLEIIATASSAGFGDFEMTDNDVLRDTHPGNGHLVYSYLSTPLDNSGNLARRTIYHSGHDFNDNGHIQDDGGHTNTGLQIIDAAGDYRGMVLSQYFSSDVWVTSRFWLDTAGTSESLSSRVGVAPPFQGAHSTFSDDFEGYTTGISPEPTWVVSSGVSAVTSVSTDQSHSDDQSLKIAVGIIGGGVTRIPSSADQLPAGAIGFSYYMESDGFSKFFYNGFNDGSGLGIQLEFRTDAAGIRTWTGSGAPLTIASGVGLNTWHDVLIVFDYESGLFDVYHDNLLIGDNLALNSDGQNGIAAHQFAVGGGRLGDLYLDDIVVQAIPEPASILIITMALSITTLRRSRTA